MVQAVTIYLYGRQTGRSTTVCRRVAELQDEGIDLVVIVVPSVRHLNHLFPLLWKADVDWSRVMLFSAQSRPSRLRGYRSQTTRIIIDDEDLIPNDARVFLHQWAGYEIDMITRGDRPY